MRKKIVNMMVVTLTVTAATLVDSDGIIGMVSVIATIVGFVWFAHCAIEEERWGQKAR